jgi:hypothetical protein
LLNRKAVIFSFELIHLVNLDIRGHMIGKCLRFYDPANSFLVVRPVSVHSFMVQLPGPRTRFYGDKTSLTSYETPFFFLLAMSAKLMIWHRI